MGRRFFQKKIPNNLPPEISEKLRLYQNAAGGSWPERRIIGPSGNVAHVS
jgi:hypothetical protein